MAFLARLAFAKINGFLHVTGKRKDGYHLLQTVFQRIHLADQLFFRTGGEDIVLDVHGMEGNCEENLVYQAAKILFPNRRKKTGIHIRLEKHIPQGAGLGGGSSDAAETLLALNALWHCGLSQQQLAEMGLSLGADIPFFLSPYACAWAEGIGEILSPLPNIPRIFVLIFPEFSLSTRNVFRAGVSRTAPHPKTLEGTGQNDCLDAACTIEPRLSVLLESLKPWGAVRMSGTGSTLFLRFSSSKAAYICQQALISQGMRAQVVKSLEGR